MEWTKVEDALPEINEPLMWYNDDTNEREVGIENYQATVLAYNEQLGVYKAKIDRNHKWSEIASSLVNGTERATPTHWMPLPTPPNQ